MNGKDLVAGALEIADKILSEAKDSDVLDDDRLIEELAKACQGLENIKNRATLRTKNGTNQAFPIKEAAENLEEAWEDARNGNGTRELAAMAAQFSDTADALAMGLRNRTVIMT